MEQHQRDDKKYLNWLEAACTNAWNTHMRLVQKDVYRCYNVIDVPVSEQTLVESSQNGYI